MTHESRSSIISISNNNLDILKIDSEFVYILFFEADWCGPCHILLPMINDISIEYSDLAFFIRVNADRNSKIAKEYGIKQLPTFVFIRKGEEYKRLIGMASQKEIEDSIFNI